MTNKFQFICIFLLGFLTPHFGNSQDSNSPLQIFYLTDDVYVYTTFGNFNGDPYPSNSMYIVTDSGVVMIDVPWDTTQLQPLLDSIMNRHGKKVVMSISTHFHADRTAGLNNLKQKGIKTFSSKLTYDLCLEHDEDQPEFYFVNDTVFKIGQYDIQTFYPGEGHTPDNIAIWLNDQKVLYGGCFVKSTEASDIGNLSDANVTAWPMSISKLRKEFPDREFVIPGHLSWESNQGLEHTLKLLERNEE